MALILDEFFTTGIPANFGTLRQQAGMLTATYDATAQAVDLSNATAGQSIWDISSVSLAVAGEMEIDLEFVSNASGALGFGGAWPVAGQAAVSNGFQFAHNTANYEITSWYGATSWAGNSAAMTYPQGNTFPFAVAGDRHVFNVRWDMSAGAGVARLAAEFRIDGNMILSTLLTYPSLRPGVTLYQSTVRLHSVKVWDAPLAALSPIGALGLASPLGSRSLPAAAAMALGMGPRAATYEGLQRSVLRFDGRGRVHGTVKEKGIPDRPVHRRVFLIDEATRTLVQEVWSDLITGAYSFDYVDLARTYTVLSYDNTGVYRAVVADGQIPEMMP